MMRSVQFRRCNLVFDLSRQPQDETAGSSGRTQSPGLGDRALNPSRSWVHVFCVLVGRAIDVLSGRLLAPLVADRFVDFPGDPESMQQHGKLARNGDDRSLLGVPSSPL